MLKKIIKKTQEKSKKDIKTTKQKKESENENKKNKWKSNKFIAVLLICFSLFFIYIVGLFLYQNLFVPKDISKILTADNTLAFAQVTITPENYAKIKTLEEKTALDSQKIIKKFETLSGSNFEKDIKSWIGPRIGVAYLKNTKTGKSFSVYFLASRNHQKALNFLSQKKLTENEKIISEKFGHYKIYSYQISQNLAYTTLQRYIVISNDTENLKNYLQTISENRLKVKNDKNFITINNNLPSRSIGFFYVNIPKLSADLNFAKYFGIIGPLLNPVLDIFPASGVAALPKDQGIVFSTYTIINKNNFKNQKLFSKQDKYGSDLLKFINQKDIAFIGGKNLQLEMLKYQEILGEIDQSLPMIFQSYLRGKVKQHFNEEISLENDLYPLFKDEFIFKVSPSQNKNVYTFVQKLTNPEKNKETILNIKDQFIKKNALFDPYIEKTNDSDIKIINPSGVINEFITTYKNNKIYTIIIPGLGYEINMGIVSNYLIVSTTKNILIENIETVLNNNNKIAEKIDTALTNEIVKFSDEIGYIDFLSGDVIPKAISEILPINYLFSGHNIFDDRMSTLNYLRFSTDLEIKEHNDALNEKNKIKESENKEKEENLED